MYSEPIIITAIICFTAIVLGLYLYHSKCSNIKCGRLEIERKVDIEQATIELPELKLPHM